MVEKKLKSKIPDINFSLTFAVQNFPSHGSSMSGDGQNTNWR